MAVVMIDGYGNGSVCEVVTVVMVMIKRCLVC